MVLAADRITVAPPGAAAPVLAGFSLAVKRGERVVVTGPIGCGKSTLVLALSGLIPIREGRVTLDGEPLTLQAPGRRRIATVLQEPTAQLTQPTVREEVGFIARNLGLEDPAGRARHWMDRLGITPEADRPPLYLSAGRQQLVLLASALAAAPEFLVVDEGTAHIDRATRERVLDEIATLCSTGLGVLWVTQHEGEVQWADHRVELGETRGHDIAASSDEVEDAIARVEIRPAAPGEGPRITVDSVRELPVPRTGIAGVIGPNGSGKTALLEILAGTRESEQVEVVSGTIPKPAIMAGQYPEMGVFNEDAEEELIWAAVRRGRAPAEVRAEARRMLVEIGAPGPWAGRKTWSLSSGERRLVHVAAALLAPASLVLLDEPTCGLDFGTADRLASVVRERARHTGIVVATQDLDWLSTLSKSRIELGD